jgi:predicted MFS family arabinose efflux permease
LIYALWIGTCQALVTPSRDGLLPRLADGQIQRRVVQVSVIQFGIQVFGFMIASVADQVGPASILTLQGIILLGGVVALYQVKVDEQLSPRSKGLIAHTVISIREGFQTIRSSPELASVTIQNCVMGTFMMGSYIVTFPLLIRESYQGTSSALAWVNSFNSVGLFATSMLLLRLGHIRRPGRALLLSLLLSGLLLACSGMGAPFRWLLVLMFIWGIGGGMIMTMSRSIMQEQAPSNQRSRIMAFFSFSFMGSGLFGALLNGYLVEWLSPEYALFIAAAGTTMATLTIAILSPLWRMESHQLKHT